jgi:hypothetical protein
MNPNEASGTILVYCGYIITLGAFLLARGTPLNEVSALAFLAWLLINQRRE